MSATDYTDRLWGRANAAKFAVGLVLAIVAGTVAGVVADVRRVNWPTGAPLDRSRW
jgi:hypothetical protein